MCARFRGRSTISIFTASKSGQAGPRSGIVTYHDSLSTEFAFLNHFSDVLKRSKNSSSVRSIGLCFLVRNRLCHLSSLNVLDALTEWCPLILHRKYLLILLHQAAGLMTKTKGILQFLVFHTDFHQISGWEQYAQSANLQWLDRTYITCFVSSAAVLLMSRK